jgi:hypothetical protein
VRSCTPCSGNHLKSVPSPIPVQERARESGTRCASTTQVRIATSVGESMWSCQKVTSRNPCATTSTGFGTTDPSFGTLLGAASFHLPTDAGYDIGARRGTERAQQEIASDEPPPFLSSSRIRGNAGYSEHASVCALCAAHIKSSSQSKRGAGVMQMQSNNR